MGKVQEAREVADRRALSIAARSEINPVTESVDQLKGSLNTATHELAQMHQELGQFLNTFLDRLERGENARAERLRLMIDPILRSTQHAVDRTVTVISHLSAGLEGVLVEVNDLRVELADLRSDGTATALNRQMKWLAEEMAKLPAAVAAQIVQVTEDAKPAANPGIRGSGRPVQNAIALEQMDKARAFDILIRDLASNPGSQKTLTTALRKAEAERMRAPPI